MISFTKFHEDWGKNVDFLLMADFERVSFFFPRTLYHIEFTLIPHYSKVKQIIFVLSKCKVTLYYLQFFFLQSNHKWAYWQSHLYLSSYEKKAFDRKSKFRRSRNFFLLPNRKMIANTSAKDVKIMKDAVRQYTQRQL